jgi:hypothetical protein
MEYRLQFRHYKRYLHQTLYGIRLSSLEQRANRFVTGTNIPTIQAKYYWHYIPVGVVGEFGIGKNVAVEPKVGARFMFYGKMAVQFSDLDPGYNTPDVKLGNKTGYYAEAPIRYKFSQFW